MKPLALGKKIEALATQANQTPQEWLTNFINENGSIKNAAEKLGASRQALSAKCSTYGIKVSGVKREFSVGD
jgi:DNA-binding NtrC family response regulator